MQEKNADQKDIAIDDKTNIINEQEQKNNLSAAEPAENEVRKADTVDEANDDSIQAPELVFKTQQRYSFELYKRFNWLKNGPFDIYKYKWSLAWLVIGILLFAFGSKIAGIAVALVCPLHIGSAYGMSKLTEWMSFRKNRNKWDADAEIELFEDGAYMTISGRRRFYNYNEMKTIYEDEAYLYLDARRDVVILNKENMSPELISAIAEMFENT